GAHSWRVSAGASAPRGCRSRRSSMLHGDPPLGILPWPYGRAHRLGVPAPLSRRRADDTIALPLFEERERMKFGLLYEHQLPRPWNDDAEHRLFQEALAQVELADQLGIDAIWQVEHHFLEEYAHSSAPEVFLAAAAARTKRIRIGHGVVLAPPGYN